MPLKKMDFSELRINPFDVLNKEWMLLSAGVKDDFNTMTVSWGALGFIWGAPAATIYVRHSRYTREFVEKNDYFTLTVLKEGYTNQLDRLGSESGRNIDKMNDSGLTPVFLDGCPTFEEARLVFICKKKFSNEILESGFLFEETLDKFYPSRDMHTMYIGEIVACYEG